MRPVGFALYIDSAAWESSGGNKVRNSRSVISSKTTRVFFGTLVQGVSSVQRECSLTPRLAALRGKIGL